MARQWRAWKEPTRLLTTKQASAKRNRPGMRYTLLIDGRLAGNVRRVEDGVWLAFDPSIQRVGSYCDLSKAGDALARRM